MSDAVGKGAGHLCAQISAKTQRCNRAQVVVRSGCAIAAVPPDYKLLDYNPETRKYLYRHAHSFEASRDDSAASKLRHHNLRANTDTDAPKNGNIFASPAAALHDDVNGGSDGRRGGSEAGFYGRREMPRGLSVVLESEAMSSPPAARMREPFAALDLPLVRCIFVFACCSVQAHSLCPVYTLLFNATPVSLAVMGFLASQKFALCSGRRQMRSAARGSVPQATPRRRRFVPSPAAPHGAEAVYRAQRQRLRCLQ